MSVSELASGVGGLRGRRNLPPPSCARPVGQASLPSPRGGGKATAASARTATAGIAF